MPQIHEFFLFSLEMFSKLKKSKGFKISEIPFSMIFFLIREFVAKKSKKFLIKI